MNSAESQFEEPLIELRRRIEELASYPEAGRDEREIARLQGQLKKRTREIYSDLSPWQKTLVARHAERPYTLDYVNYLTSDWVELHGDRVFSDDAAIVGGLADFRGRSVMIIGHQKGRGTKERIRRNFGQPQPDGYRKALRLMKLAERFGLPVITMIDTAGAYPGLEAEERGQAEAIARNLEEMAGLKVPIVCVVTGEGGSGGALALGVGNRVYVLEYGVYSVISPEGCAAILWKDQAQKSVAAAAMRITAPDLLRLGVVDGVIPEPQGGAHTDNPEMARRVGDVLEGALDEIASWTPAELLDQRYKRFRALGRVEGA